MHWSNAPALLLPPWTPMRLHWTFQCSCIEHSNAVALNIPMQLHWTFQCSCIVFVFQIKVFSSCSSSPTLSLPLSSFHSHRPLQPSYFISTTMQHTMISIQWYFMCYYLVERDSNPWLWIVRQHRYPWDQWTNHTNTQVKCSNYPTCMVSVGI